MSESETILANLGLQVVLPLSPPAPTPGVSDNSTEYPTGLVSFLALSDLLLIGLLGFIAYRFSDQMFSYIRYMVTYLPYAERDRSLWYRLSYSYGDHSGVLEQGDLSTSFASRPLVAVQLSDFPDNRSLIEQDDTSLEVVVVE